MSITLFTYEWVPEGARGLVREFRVRWALEEIGRSYEVSTVPVSPKSAEHRAMQPFAQIPVIRDGDLNLFESGAIALHLAEGTTLMPDDRRAEVTQWVIAALNTVEIAIVHWMMMDGARRKPEFFGPAPAPDVIEYARQDMRTRLGALETLFADREWLTGDFSVADLMMADVLRLAGRIGGLDDYSALASYVARAMARPAFEKAMTDHMAHWLQADAALQAKQSA